MSGAGPRALDAQARVLAEWWAEADRVLVGAGAGLSAAAGIDYGDRADFARTFPALARQGFEARDQLIGYEAWSLARHWAYWATHVHDVRFRDRTHAVYARLRALAAGKDAFVLTSNVDAMFVRHGLDPERVFTPQGDYAAMQCRTPCRRVVWPSRPAIERALAHVDPERFEVTDPAAIPSCPSCGGEVFLNVRLDRAFVEEPYRAQAARLREWLSGASRRRLLLVEIGAGMNTPAVVRWPMERIAARHPEARFVRINRDDPDLGDAPPGRSVAIAADAGAAIEALSERVLPARA